MDEIDIRIVDELQAGFPLGPTPFHTVAESIGLSEATLIARIDRLLRDGVLTRFGPMFNADRLGGAFTLAAMSVPAAQLERVVALVNAHPEVAHNYERDHALNVWFVVATEVPEQRADVLAAIEAETGYPVYDFPKEEEFFVNLQLRMV